MVWKATQHSSNTDLDSGIRSLESETEGQTKKYRVLPASAGQGGYAHLPEHLGRQDVLTIESFSKGQAGRKVPIDVYLKAERG